MLGKSGVGGVCVVAARGYRAPMKAMGGGGVGAAGSDDVGEDTGGRWGRWAEEARTVADG